MLSAELELVRERLGLTRVDSKAANAPNIIGQLEWEEDRRPDAIPYTPKQCHGRFTAPPSFPQA